VQGGNTNAERDAFGPSERDITMTTNDPTPGHRPRRTALMVGAAFLAGSVVAGTTAALAVTTFTDVPPDHSFRSEIDWGVGNGITEGFDDGTFKPTNPVSRQASMAFLSRYNDAFTQVVSATNPAAGTSWAVTVDCPAGKRVFGGGGRNTIDTVVMTASYPLDFNTWRVAFVSRSGASVDPGILDAYAYCIPDVAGP
jgi:hypothetical protein